MVTDKVQWSNINKANKQTNTNTNKHKKGPSYLGLMVTDIGQWSK